MKNKSKKTVKKEKKQRRIISFSTRLLMLCLIPMLVVCGVIATFSTVALKRNIEEEIENSLRIVATSVSETYTNLYEGDYSVDYVGKVRKGDVAINMNTALIDAMKEQSGFDVSMLFSNSRLITTVPKENGARATGIPADKKVYTTVEETGESVFISGLELFGIEYYALYQPLINSDGSVIGAIEVVTQSASVEKAVNEQITLIILISVGVVLLAAAVVIIMARGMAKRMARIKMFLEKLVSGRLDYEATDKDLKANDELGDIYRSCTKVQTSFKDIVGEIIHSCDNLKSAADIFSGMAKETAQESEGVKEAVDEIANGARKQADATVDAHQNVAMISNQISLITTEVEDIAASAAEIARMGQSSESIIGELSLSNDHTKESISRVAEQIMQMSSAVKGIKEAVAIIQAIADETDLLSLNASIEAARAGEAGRGFKVVAEQISKLALQSNESSKDIERMLAGITDTSDKMVAVMGEVRVNMDTQQIKLEETQSTCSAVTAGVDKSYNRIQGIKDKVGILNVSGESINGVVEELAEISEENASTALKTKDSAENMSNTMQTIQESAAELLQLADRLQHALGDFHI